MARLRAEMDQLLEQVRVQGASVGSAELVVFDQQFARENEIGEFGRMTIHDGKRLYHAGQKMNDQGPSYECVLGKVLHYGARYQRGDSMDLNLNSIVARDEWPRKLGKDKSHGLYSIEERLFVMMRSKEITAINPSFKTLASLHRAFIGAMAYVYVTSYEDDHYRLRVRDFCNKAGNLEMVTAPKGVSYLGSGNPNFYPDGLWFRLIPSPYLVPGVEMSQFLVKWSGLGYTCSYERKKGYFIHTHLNSESPHFILNPETVDALCEDPGRPKHMAFVESSFGIEFAERDDRRIYQKPWFLSPKGTWEEYKGLKILVDRCLVYDVQGTGTYMSRRHRIQLPDGLAWAPFQTAGTHWVTMSSLHPHRDYNVRVQEMGGRTLVLFGDCEAIEAHRVVESCFFDYDATIAPTIVRSQKYGHTLNEIWRDQKGLYYPEELRREDAVAWSYQTDGIPFLHAAELQCLSRFVGHRSFVNVSSLPKGLHFISPSREYMTTAIPQAVKYYSLNYFGLQTFSTFAVVPEAEGDAMQSTLAGMFNNIHKQFAQRNVVGVYENAKTATLVGDTLGIPARNVTMVCMRSRQLKIWKPLISGQSQWVHIDSLQVRFAGKKQQRQFQVDGLLWKEVLSEVDRGVQMFVSSVELSHFRTFCLNNGYRFLYGHTGIEEEQIVTYFFLKPPI